jgi:rRNA maturation endonuclease Nob1
MAKVGSTKSIIESKPGAKARFAEPGNLKDKENVAADPSKKKLAMFLTIKAREEGKRDQWNHANVCPDCHITLPKTGHCSFCGKDIQIKKVS